MRRFPSLALAILAGLAGFGLNFARPVLFTNIEWVFGGLFPLLAAMLGGRWVGLLAGLVAFAGTWIFWKHPWGIAAYGLEAFVVGHLVQRHGVRLFRASLSYWLLLGTPIAALFFLNPYLGFPSNYIALAKYPLNGLAVALVAQAIVDRQTFRRLRKKFGQLETLRPLHQLLTAQFSSFTALPILVSSFLFFGVLDAKVTEQAQQQLRAQSDALTLLLTRRLEVASTEWRRDFVLPQTSLPTPSQLTAWLEQRPGWTSLSFQSANPLHPVVSARTPGHSEDAAVFVATVTDADGNQAATIRGTLDLSEFLQDLPALADPIAPDVLVLNAERRPLLLPRTLGPELVPDVLHSTFLDEVAMGKTHFTHDRWRPATLRIERYRCYAQPIPGTDWILILEDPLWRTQSESINLFILSVALTLLAVGLVHGLSRATATEITTPLRQLAQHTATLSEGTAPATLALDQPPASELVQIQNDVVAATERLNQTNQRLAEAIADRDRSQAEIESVLKQLEQTVADRTADLTEALAAARAADRAKGEFLAMMSHELRTPLNVMLGSVELLRSGRFGPLSAHQQASVSAIETNGRHLLLLIQDILDYSKDEFKQLTVQRENVDPRDECDRALELIGSRLQAKNLALHCSYQHEGARVWADPKRLRQMVLNLLTNAVKFTPDGGRVDLAVTRLSPALVRITVSDTGIGIAPEHLDDIFLPFHQIDRSLARSFDGSGLGLTLVRRLAELHDGTVTVNSILDRGSHFHIDLPVAPNVSPPSPEPAAHGAATAVSPAVVAPAFRPVKRETPTDEALVLIVEDNAINAELIRNYLRILGCKGTVARDGIEGLELLSRLSPDLVLMDVQMPRMDGIEATKAIRGLPDPRLSTVPIVMVSALAMASDRQRAIQAGADDYLCKPFSLKDFQTMIGRHLPLRQGSK